MASINHIQTQYRASGILSHHAQRLLFLLVLGFVDVCSLIAAFAFSHWLRFTLGLAISEGDPSYNPYIRLAVIFIPLWLVAFYFSKLYNSSYLFVGTQEYGRITQVCTLIMMLMVGLAYFDTTFIIARGWIVFAWLSTIIFVNLSRFMMRRIAYFLRSKGFMRTVTLVVGADDEGRAIAKQLRETSTCGANVIGFLDDQLLAGSEIEGLPVLGQVSAIQQIIGKYGIEEVLLSMSALTHSQVIKIYETYSQSEAVTLRFSPGLLELFTTGAFVREWGTVPLVSINKVRLGDWDALIKRCLDLIISISALIILSPIMFLIAIFVVIDSPGPVFHRRYVLGQGGRLFDALKFRTMYVDGSDILEAYPDLREELKVKQKIKEDPRVTPMGRLLRKTSLDELPQLLNVLVGQMSVVGPRMITRPEQENYGKLRFNLLTVKPGITGLWQVSGRSDLSYEERVRMDMNYIRNYSLWLDLMIMLKTFPVIIKGHGAY